MSWSAYVDTGDLPRRLRGFAAQMLDLRPFWPIAATIGRGWLKQQFESQGSWGGDPWAPLSADYAAWKAEKYPGKPLLVAEGDLRQAVSRPEREVTATTMELRIVDPKVRFHQDGTRKMPARPVVPQRIPEHALDELREAFDGWVDEVMRRWGLR